MQDNEGACTFHDEVQYAGFAFSPFYYGLEDALSIHSLWGQETNPVILTPRRVRTGVRQFNGRNCLVRHIDRRMFFGYSYHPYGNFHIPASTIEKALIDFVYFKIRLPEDVLHSIMERIDSGTMEDYLEETSAAVRRRVADLLESLEKAN